MKTSRCTEAQIMVTLRQAESGVPIAQLCREHSVIDASFYRLRAKYGGLAASIVSQMKAMKKENRWLKCMHADLSMQNDLLKETFEKKRYGPPRYFKEFVSDAKACVNASGL